MTSLDLAREDAEVLLNVIDSALFELHTEINHTDDREYRAYLKKRRESLERARSALEGGERGAERPGAT